MKILVIGDFHGKFPEKLMKQTKKVDLVISVGDYPPFHYRKIWFKHCYGKDVLLWEVIGKKKYKELVLEDLRRAENVLKKLNKVKVPVFTTLGNVDYPFPNDVSDEEDIARRIGKKYWKWGKGEYQKVINLLKKYSHIKRFDYRAIKFGGLVFIGMRGHSFPGHVKSKNFKKHKEKLERLFRKYKKENKEGKVIFVSHIVPYNTKLDKLGKHAEKKARGKHYGSKLTRRIIEKFQPILAIGGHIHENMGKDKIGKTLVINSGAAVDNNAAIVDIDEKKGKVKNVKFLR